MSEEIRFSVWTTPVPKGSMIARQFGKRAFVVPENDGDLKKYARKIGRFAEVAMTNHFGRWSVFAKDVAIEIEVRFYLLRPKSAPKSRKLPTVKPDVDKLSRALCDALKGKCYEDDSQVTDLISRKRYGYDEGVEIILRRAEEIARPLELALSLPRPVDDDF